MVAISESIAGQLLLTWRHWNLDLKEGRQQALRVYLMDEMSSNPSAESSQRCFTWRRIFSELSHPPHLSPRVS